MAFTWFDKFTDVLASIPDEGQRRELEVALVEYGAFGAEPELAYPVSAIFAAVREDMDNSIAKRASGSKGGRPGKKPVVSESEKPLVSESEKPLVSESEKPLVSENPAKNKNPNQTKPNQTKPNQTKRDKGAASRAFAPPTVEEVSAYVSEKGYTFDPEAFVAHYAARGWCYGRGQPMKDWKAACVTWQKHEEPAKRTEDEDDGWWRRFEDGGAA